MPKYKAPLSKKDEEIRERQASTNKIFFKAMSVIAFLIVVLMVYTLSGGLKNYQDYLKTHFGVGWGLYVMTTIMALSLGAFSVMDESERPNGYLIVMLGAIMTILYPFIWDGNKLVFAIIALVFAVPSWIAMLQNKSKFAKKKKDPLGIRKNEDA